MHHPKQPGRFSKNSNLPSRCDSRGLTLLELLVVVVIIGILVLLLIPIVGTLREQARIGQLVNNLRHSFAAYWLMVGENDMKLPVFVGGTGNESYIWTTQLRNDGYLPREAGSPEHKILFRPQDPWPPQSYWWGLGLNLTPGPHCQHRRTRLESGQNPMMAFFNYANLDNVRDHIVLADTVQSNGRGPRGAMRFRYDGTTLTGSGIRIDKHGLATGAFADGSVQRLDVPRLVEMGVEIAFDDNGDPVALED